MPSIMTSDLRVMPTQPPCLTNDSCSPSKSTPTFSFYLDWTIRLLSLTAALLFGIWAPLAYTATLVANRDADAFQTTLSRRLDDLAAMQQTVHERLHELEILKVWEFCAGPGADVGACRALMNGKGNETVERLGRVIGNAFATPTSTTKTISTGIVSSTTGGGVVSRVPSSSSEATITATTSPTASAIPMPIISGSPNESLPPVGGHPQSSRNMDLSGLGVAAGIIGVVALLVVMCMRSRSKAYRGYHRV